MSFILGLLALSGLTSAYVWPNPQLDELERLLFDQHDYNQPGILASIVTPCDRFSFGHTANRSNAADWLRAAYHDIATHDAEAGTGGLDASVRFEINREENAGTGIENALKHLSVGMTRYVSLSDLIALGAKTAVEQCGGYTIPFRGGRVDATKPGPLGVPQPHESLDSHTAAFARQGFSKTDMIALVACGHSFGGVQASVFPHTVPLPDGAYDFQAPFDSTPVHFDNNVATEYISGTTTNPLVVGPNVTTRSDHRIFASDGNATMQAFADSPELFQQTCSDMFARMIDTVAKNVTLTEVIEPLPIKPQSVLLTYMGDGSLRFSGQVRFWNTSESSMRSIKMNWADRDGKKDSSYTSAVGHDTGMVATAKYHGDITSLWYNFGDLDKNYTVLDETKGISNFWFEVDEGNGSGVRTEDQNGTGFVVQDQVMLASTSCITTTTRARIDIAVRSDQDVSKVYLEHDALYSGNQVDALYSGGIYDHQRRRRGGGGDGTVISTVEVKTVDAPRAASQPDGSRFTIYTAELPQNALSASMTREVNIVAEINGQKVTTANFQPFSLFANMKCDSISSASSTSSAALDQATSRTNSGARRLDRDVTSHWAVVCAVMGVLVWGFDAWWMMLASVLRT